MEKKNSEPGKKIGSDTQHIFLSDEERQVCEVWTRVMGYHRPMSSFNKGKKGEFYERRYFRECKANLA